MQQIADPTQNKKAPNLERSLICNNSMVRQVDYRWNQIYPSMLIMYEKLAKFDLNSGGKDRKIT